MLFLVLLLAVGAKANTYNNLVINTPAHSCGDLFTEFPDLCNITGYNVKKSDTILCNNIYSTCSSDTDTFCSLEDCCGPSEVITGTCEQFFDARPANVCEDNGFLGPNTDTTLCDGGDTNECDAFTCCGPAASSCQALFALNENPLLENSNTSYVGDYSCNIHKWYKPVSAPGTVTPIVAGDFVREDCCEVKQTCGVLYDDWNGTDTCYDNGFEEALDSSHHCDDTGNTPCTISQCCNKEITCKAYNLEANGYSTVGTAQNQQCTDKGYAYAQPFANRPCYNGNCKHKDCCIRQLTCASYSADNDRICQNQGYPFYEQLDTACLKGLCTSYQCCAIDCPNGYNADRVCNP